MAIILSERDVEPLLSDPANMDGLLALTEESFRDYNQGAIAGQVRLETSLLDREKKYRITTSAVPGAGQGMRISALFRGPKNAYFVVLFDCESGDLLALIGGRQLNVWRTAAPGGIAGRYLAPKGADALGIVGSGRQARGQLIAFRRALPQLRSASVFSRSRDRREAFAEEMTARLGIPVRPVASAQAAVAGMPIVSLATSSRSTVIESQWVAPGALIVSITSGQLPRDVIGRSRVVVSWKEEVLGGEAPRQPYSAMIADGSWSADKIVAELGEIILGTIAAREKVDDTVVFECAGMPVWDTVTAAWAYRWALEQKAGKEFSFE